MVLLYVPALTHLINVRLEHQHAKPTRLHVQGHVVDAIAWHCTFMSTTCIPIAGLATRYTGLPLQPASDTLLSHISVLQQVRSADR